MILHVHGKVTYQNLEGGFWGIISDSQKYLVLDMPEQLKCDGLIVDCYLKQAKDIVSIYSWGEPVFIHGFKTSVFPNE